MSDLDVVMPALGQSVAEGTVVRWLVAPGDRVVADASLVIIQTDKAETEVPAPQGGRVTELLVAEGETVDVGTALLRLSAEEGSAGAGTSEEGSAGARTSDDGSADAPRSARAGRESGRPASPTSATSALARSDRRETAGRFLSPAVRRLAREARVSQDELRGLPGSGRGGRLTHSDLAAWIGRRAGDGKRATSPSAEDERVIPLTGLRARIAANVSASRREIPEVNTVSEADMSRVAAARHEHGPAFEARHGFKLSWNAFLLKASALTLAEFPRVNAVVDQRGIVEHRRVHLGMAVALEPEGLVVPVVRDADSRSVREIALETRRLAELARAGRLTADDMAGGTCTVTNPGVFGTLLGTPVLHAPQAAIVDFGAIKKRVVATDDDAIAVRPMAYVVLAWDHRAMDGATASRFLRRLVDILESWPGDSID